MDVKTAIRVVSLQNALQRRQQFSAATGDAIPDWEFFPAVQGSCHSLAYDREETIRDFGRPLTNAELGCYGSHVKLWQWFISSSYDQLFVFEDDVAMDPIVLEKLTQCNLSLLGINILRMYSTHHVRMRLVVEAMLSPHSHLFQVKGKIFGTQAYCLTREAAKALLLISEPVRQPIDWLMMRYWDYKIPNFIIFPYPLFERHLPSSIDTSEASLSAAASMFQKASRTRRNFRDRAVREWLNRTTFSGAEKTVIRNVGQHLRSQELPAKATEALAMAD